MIKNSELKNEKKYLDGVIDTLEDELSVVNNKIYDHERNLKETSEYISSSFYEMDDEEKASAKAMLEQLQINLISFMDYRTLLERQKESAYFGRIDFQATDETKPNPYYIGISHVIKAGVDIPLVLDWRAPLSSMYYDYELGKASYTAPMGEIKGEISLKRQYKTNDRNLIYAFDSNLTINDEILRQTLAGNADSKMKNIVATIQAEQNKIIRENEGNDLVVQGVAGSGKTSIALHRVAYILYKNKIKAKDILIISPSALFSDYISNVLPELGEQNTPKITFDEIASNELSGFVNFEPKSQMLEDIILNNDKSRLKAIQLKNSFKFFEDLKEYLNKVVSVSFKAKDIKLGKSKISASVLDNLFSEKYKTKTPAVRIEWIADYIVDQLGVSRQNEKNVFKRVKKVLFAMFEDANILSIYESFLKTQKLKLNKAQLGKDVYIGYEDMPGVLYIKNYLLGVEIQKDFKHIIIDEMQDYSPIALAMINKIFPAPKTLLGDINQTFEKELKPEYLDNLKSLQDRAKLLNLNTTYRSTMQIAMHNQSIKNLKNINNFNRIGVDVNYIKNNNNLSKKLQQITEKLSKKYESIAVITTSIKQSEDLSSVLGDFTLITESSGEAKNKKVVVPVVYSKGLEFDAVVFIGDNNLSEEQKKLYKNIKYIACTRALHELFVVE